MHTSTDVDFFHPGIDYGLFGSCAGGMVGGWLAAGWRGWGRSGGGGGQSSLLAELLGFLGEVLGSRSRPGSPLVPGSLEPPAAERAVGEGGSWHREQLLVVMLVAGLPGPAVIFRTVVWDVIILRIFLAWRKFRIDVVRVHQIRAHDH